ncbi:hypothetical protein SUDANB176_03736 [Streptomyces sp. enrichment culture]|uniref:beta-ketoacyl synthase N-terminal-like domain-containing protein n=1 Tax=Streptomyces sp. enrichment culture TaxID=1795815 RepID=UPI003F569494
MNASHRAPRELAVTGVGVVSPWGDTPRTAAAAGGAPLPGGEEWFDHRTRLGPRGYKYLPAAALYALAAARAALADGGRPDAVPADRRGLVLATNAGLAELFDAMDRTVVREGATGIAPASAPYFAVNVLGNRLAAELSLNGFALTVATARTAALDGLAAGALALAAGRCESLLLAAAEEPPPGHGALRGEQGAVVLALESPAAARARGAGVRATVASRSLFLPPAALDGPGGRARAQRVLADALARLLRPTGGPAGRDPDRAATDRAARGPAEARGGADAPATPVELHLALDSSPVSEAVAGALAGVGGRAPDAGHDGAYPVGEPGTAGPPAPRTGCLGPALALARAVTAPGRGPRLVACATGSGHVALALVRPGPPHHTQESQHAEVT